MSTRLCLRKHPTSVHGMHRYGAVAGARLAPEREPLVSFAQPSYQAAQPSYQGGGGGGAQQHSGDSAGTSWGAAQPDPYSSHYSSHYQVIGSAHVHRPSCVDACAVPPGLATCRVHDGHGSVPRDGLHAEGSQHGSQHGLYRVASGSVCRPAARANTD